MYNTFRYVKCNLVTIQSNALCHNPDFSIYVKEQTQMKRA